MIVVGTTLCAFAMSQKEVWASWMDNAEIIREKCPDTKYFAAIEVDKRGLEPFGPFLERLKEIDGEYWTYSLDDGRTSVTTANRLRHITMGQNLVTDFCCSILDCSHLLFMAADCRPPDDVMERMLELNHPFCAPWIPTYCIRGPIDTSTRFNIMKCMPSVACVFIARQVFKRLRWRWQLDDPPLSDDPAYYLDAKELLGIEAWVRDDCRAKHYPEAIGAIETRGYDLRVVRE